METLANGLLTLINGLFNILDFALSPFTIAAIFLGFSLLWLMLLEIDELDRQGTKPEVGRH
jgi:hypothetical protein